ncbi:pyridoxal-phosphate dependent enzyme [Spirillospora sp. CA-255316]
MRESGLAHELLGQFPHIDVLVCAVGTSGHSAGVHQVLKWQFPDLRLVGVDAVGSTIFGQPARSRLMRGLGSGIHPRNIASPAPIAPVLITTQRRRPGRQ